VDKTEDAAREVVGELQDRGFAAWWVGGAVRDRIMGKDPAEYDVATVAHPEEVLRIFRKELACTAVEVGKAYGVVRVEYRGHWFEVATLRSDKGYSDKRHPDKVEYGTDPRLDAERRDFTVNALFQNPVSGEVLDFVGGQEDIERKVMRTVGRPEDRFTEDHLRKLRLIRFATRLWFEIDPATWQAAVNDPTLDVSAERIRDELVKMLTGPAPGRALRLLHESGLLKQFLPEASAMAGVEQPPMFHPEGDVFTHTVKMFDLAEKPIDEVLALTLLLHDIGKPPCFDPAKPDGKIRFPGHEVKGAEMAEEILKRLRFPNETIDAVKELIREHMRIKDAPEMRQARLLRFFANPLFEKHLELHRLDCAASLGKMNVYEFLVEKYTEWKNTPKLPEPFINGNDLMAMGVKPGPFMGKVLNEVRDLQLDGTIKSREEAMDAAKKLIEKGL